MSGDEYVKKIFGMEPSVAKNIAHAGSVQVVMHHVKMINDLARLYAMYVENDQRAEAIAVLSVINAMSELMITEHDAPMDILVKRTFNVWMKEPKHAGQLRELLAKDGFNDTITAVMDEFITSCRSALRGMIDQVAEHQA